MHIAFWSPAWPAIRHANGISTYVHWMTQALERGGHKVSIFTHILESGAQSPRVHRVHGDRDRIRRIGERIVGRTRSDEDRLFDFGSVIGGQMLKVHRREPIDVVEMEETFGWFRAVQSITALPLVVRLHGPAFLTLNALGQKSFARRRQDAEAQSLPTASAITAPSRVVLTRTMGQFALSARQLRQINNPLALASDTPTWRLKSCDRQAILFVGRFDWLKGADVVLKAFGLLARRSKSLKLIFVGPDHGMPDVDGSTVSIQTYLRRHLAPSIGDRVDYRGPLSQEQVAQLRVRSMVTVLASRWETQPYTLLEAMLQGCPVVSSDAGACPESVEDGVTGLLAASGDADGLAARIWALLEDPLRAAAVGEAARRHVLGRHAPEIVAAETLDFYRQVVSTAPPVRAAASATSLLQRMLPRVRTVRASAADEVVR